MKSKIIVGVFGLLGVLLCGSSVIAWTLTLGQPQNYLGAVLVAFLCGCAGWCCSTVVMGRKF